MVMDQHNDDKITTDHISNNNTDNSNNSDPTNDVNNSNYKKGQKKTI